MIASRPSVTSCQNRRRLESPNNTELVFEDVVTKEFKKQTAIKMDQRIENLDNEERLYLEGASAGLAVSLLRNQNQLEKLPLFARTLSENHCGD